MSDETPEGMEQGKALLSRRPFFTRGAAVAGMGASGAALPRAAQAQAGVSDSDPSDDRGHHGR